MADRLVPVDDNYLFLAPLEVRLATKMTASVTDSAVASRVNGTQTGAAIDQRITTQATPLVQPIVASYIASSQVVVDAAAAAVNANPTIATLEADKWKKGGVPLNADLSTLVTPGAYVVSSATTALSLTPALPDGFANIGVVEVLTATSNTYRAYRWTNIAGTNRGVFQIEYQNGTWTAWHRIDYDLKPRVVPNGANIDTYIRAGGIYDGAWISGTDAVTASITGLPAGETSLFHLQVLPGTGHQTIQFYNGGLYWRGVTSVGTGALAPWTRIDKPASIGGNYAEERAVRLDQARQRTGGKIGTGGLPTVVLRFDDWADDMEAKVMPRLRARNLPACWAATVDYIEDPSKGSQTWATVGQWVHNGIELMGHSWSHANASSFAGILKEVVESADYIENQVPTASIDTWVMPGTGAGAATYDGFGVGDIVANYYSTDAGRMLLGRYPVICGAVPGRHMPLVGTQAIGQTHTTFENDTAASAIAKVQAAMDAGSGITMMAHPIHLGGAVGKMTLADFDTFLDWIVAERDAGRLLVLTARGQAFADASVSRRLNLFKNADFKNGLNGWGGATDYTLGVDGDRPYAATSTGLQLEQTFDMTSYGYLRGGVVELSALVRVVGADAEVRTALTGTASTRTITAAEGWRRVSHVATISKNLDVAATLTGFVGRASGGEVQVAETAICPV